MFNGERVFDSFVPATPCAGTLREIGPFSSTWSQEIDKNEPREQGEGDVPDSPAPGVFLSYRRKNHDFAQLLHAELTRRFPNARVFRDVDSIEPGLDFAEVITEAVNSCTVLVALFGGKWGQGYWQLKDRKDFVRLELHTALKRNVRIVPVLLDGAHPPSEEELPKPLKQLARLQALRVITEDWAQFYGRRQVSSDMDHLADVIGQILAAESKAVRAEPKAPAAEPEALAADLFWEEERFWP
jgi:hypothetical protein